MFGFSGCANQSSNTSASNPQPTQRTVTQMDLLQATQTQALTLCRQPSHRWDEKDKGKSAGEKKLFWGSGSFFVSLIDLC
jgi:hypothetical protein